ncbi:MAG: hypothetical protein ACOCP8_00365 [archaeon]
MDREKHVFTLSREGERMFSTEFVIESNVRTLRGIEIYIEEKQKTPLIIRDKKKYLSGVV